MIKQAGSLFLACKEGNIKNIEHYFKNKKFKDFWINGIEISTGLTPIHVAAVNGKTDVIKLLIENGANVDIRSQVKCK